MMSELTEQFLIHLYSLGFAAAADSFCKKHLTISRTKEILFLFLLFCGRILLSCISRYDTAPSIIFSLLEHLYWIGLIGGLFQSSTKKKLLAASILTAAVTLTENFCISFLSWIALIDLHIVKQIPIPVLEEPETRWITYISLLLTLGILFWLSGRLRSLFYCRSGAWYVTLSIPLLTVTALIDLANWGAESGILVRSGGSLGLYYDQLLSHGGFCILNVLCIFAVSFYVYGMHRICLEQEKNSQYDAQIRAYQMLEEQYRQSERLQHDLKNHILALLGLFEHQEWEKMKDYLMTMEDCVLFSGDRPLTGNPILDMLLYQKQQAAQNRNIHWECQIQMGKPGTIREFDLCVLLGNILDNAIEACEKIPPNDSVRPFIQIQASFVKKCFLLEVKNSVAVAPVRQNVVSLTKIHRKRGIGLPNVRDVVEKYHGIMDADLQEGVFVISVLIPQSDTVHDSRPII